MPEHQETGPLPPSAGRPSWRGRLERLGRSRWAYVAASCLLLLPCYWQPRVQAGDLASHIYNAWMVQLIETGRVDGLAIVNQTTNVLFDLLLSALFRVFGAEAAQRIAVSLAVLVFIWGAFALVAACSGRKPWHLLPCLAMLAYGWVFHMGFFNFYLSLGLCLWALALLWEWNPRRWAPAAALLVLAYLAHALPVAWAVCLAGYLAVARPMSPRARLWVSASSLAAMTLLHVVLSHRMTTRWSPGQVRLLTGADQVWVFDGKYYFILVGLLLVWGVMFIHLLRGAGARSVASSLTFHLCLLSAAGVFILPTTVLIPGFQHALVYISERMSLGVGVFVCALLGAARPRAGVRGALLALSLVFFGFLFRDERALNALEDRMQNKVALLPPNQRVINTIQYPGLRVNALDHMIDRICIGRCFSYANYEPSNAQFRVRVLRENPYVAARYVDSWRLQNGLYVPLPRDLPMYAVDLDGAGNVIIRSLEAGVPCGSTYWNVLPDRVPRA